MTTNNQIRPGNRAFEYLLNHYQPLDAKITPLVNVLPVLGDELYGYAQTGAEVLPRTVRTNLWPVCLLPSPKHPIQTRKTSSPFAFLIYNCASTLTLFFLIAVINNWHPFSRILYSIKRRVTKPRRLLIPKFGTKALKGRAVSPNICYHASNSRTSVIYRHGSLERKSQQFFTATPKTSQLSSASATFQLLSE